MVRAVFAQRGQSLVVQKLVGHVLRVVETTAARTATVSRGDADVTLITMEIIVTLQLLNLAIKFAAGTRLSLLRQLQTVV